MVDKREIVQLAHTYDANKHDIIGWLASEKLDGMRAWWDGGITKGVMAHTIPWANTAKDKKIVISTGLWSRKGKVVWAPKWWTDRLPKVLLDGELWSEDLTFEEIMSITRSQKSDDPRWSKITFKVFDSPNLSQVLRDGDVYMGPREPKLEIRGAADFWAYRELEAGRVIDLEHHDFEFRRLWLEQNTDVDLVDLVTIISEAHIDELLNAALLLPNRDGIVAKRPDAFWSPDRSWEMLKIKDAIDTEGTVVGYTWGCNDNSGRLGALILEWEGKRLELSGMRRAERELLGTEIPQDGKDCGPGVHSLYFPRGSQVTFKYRELSSAGIPKEARYLRRA